MLVLRGTTLYYKVRLWHYKVLLCTIRVLVCTMGADVGASRALPTGSVQKAIFVLGRVLGRYGFGEQQMFTSCRPNPSDIVKELQRYCQINRSLVAKELPVLSFQRYWNVVKAKALP